MRPVLCYGNVTWILTQKAEHMLKEFEKKIIEKYTAQHKRKDTGARME
jgi:hypothetical protein